MAEKILATFRCDSNKWQQFKAQAEAYKTSASAILLQFIDWYLAGNNLPLNNSICIDKEGEFWLNNVLENRLAQLLEARLSNMLDTCLDKKVSLLNSRAEAALNGVHQRLEWVEGTVAELLADQRAEKEVQQSQQVAPPPEPDWDSIRTRVLKSLGVGKQAKLYKQVAAELDRIISAQNPK